VILFFDLPPAHRFNPSEAAKSGIVLVLAPSKALGRGQGSQLCAPSDRLHQELNVAIDLIVLFPADESHLEVRRYSSSIRALHLGETLLILSWIPL